MSSSHDNLFNLITIIASPKSPCDESGTVKIYPMLNQLKFQKFVTTLNP